MDCKTIKLAQTNEEWLVQRRAGIGGSDIAGIMGMSPWSTPRKVYLSKTEGTEQKESYQMKIGTKLEATVAELFSEETGLKVRRAGYMYQDREVPYFLANIDRLIQGQNAILECKTTSSYNADAWADGAVPPHYYLQVQWYLGITKADAAYICCLIGNAEFANVLVAPDRDLIGRMRVCAKAFWEDHVLTGIAPEAEALDLEDLKAQARRPEATELPDECLQLLQRRKDAKALQDAAGAEIKEIDAQLLDALGAYEEGRCGAWKLSCKQESRTSVDSAKLKKEYPDVYEACKKQSQSFPLRIKEGK